ncbi:MAG: hypothetical protein Athens071425_444 [Parcubacteria group bacterium Athens0714_25]|nr:MAG: hypothetical protein Athens071425_444 [Parcubacteria group bacterium Athens0714_25]
MYEKSYLEKPSVESEEKKERMSDSCLEGLIKHIKEYEGFYDSKFVRESSNNEFGFSEDEGREMEMIIRKLKDKILDLYENNHDFFIEGEGQAKHIFGNSILVNAGAFARRYSEGKNVRDDVRKIIRYEMSLLNDYTKGLLEDDDFLRDEITFEKGYLNGFRKFFKDKKEISPKSPNRIALANFFHDLSGGGIKKSDFERRLEDVQESQNILDEDELQKHLFAVDNKGEEYYKLV